MRINRLELIKYGKFTDRVIDLPHAAHDFHLIVGPNEAGKSTLRLAVQELLFGMPARSTMAFVHLQPDLRLGATLSDATQELSFHRTKATKNTLRSPTNDILSDQALLPFLGAADRKFFDQMFGLDHTRLVEGGKQILDASNDLGQLLFQSAAGIAGMGAIRAKLEEEADNLWGARLKRTREYSIGQEKLDAASADLKAASIKAKSWSEASAQVQQRAQSIKEAKEAHRLLEVERSRLERQRRTAGLVREAREAEAALEGFKDAVELPSGSAALLSQTQQSLAGAASVLTLRSATTQRILASQANVVVDEAVLARAAAIDELDALRLQYVAYPTDKLRRQAEVDAQWAAVCQECHSLGWDTSSEDALRARVPGATVRAALAQTALAHSGLLQAVHAAQEALDGKVEELADLQRQHDDIGAGVVPAPLKTAETQARALGDVHTAATVHAAALLKANGALEAALNRLGKWRVAPAALEAMTLPGEAVITGFVQQRQLLDTQGKAARELAQDDADRLAEKRVEINEFQQSHQAVAAEEVAGQRSVRNSLWQAIKTGVTTVQAGSEPFETAMTGADHLADRRLDNVEAAAQLQSLEQECRRIGLEAEKSRAASTRIDSDIAADLKKWTTYATAAGLDGMPLELAIEWLGKRVKAIEAQRALEVVQEKSDEHDRATEAARQVLLKAMTSASIATDIDAALADLCTTAKDWMQEVQAAAIRKQGLSDQMKTATQAGKEGKQTLQKAKEALEEWQKSWEADLKRVGLPVDSDITSAARAVESIKSVDDGLAKMSAIRKERIQTMDADLDEFKERATLLATDLAPTMLDASAQALCLHLSTRLAEARANQTEALRHKTDLAEAKKQEEQARETIQNTKALLAPLLTATGIDAGNEALESQLAECIERSDQKRGHQVALTSALADLAATSDGLSRAEIEAELAGADLSLATSELTRLQVELAENVTQHASLSAEHANSVRNLAEMVGSDNAATAEARRQEALAQMADAAERYVKVATAAALLRWSIDQYREQKQGPLLARASAIFSRLTLSAFKRLHVDFDADKMSLAGQRANGDLVQVAGLSDGTRDQLYFALRLAALEMHLDQATQLPMLADDLFINYDDERSTAGLSALKELSTKTQVIFLTHHHHLLGPVKQVFGDTVNIVTMARHAPLHAV